jgi:hypothetical protein
LENSINKRKEIIMGSKVTLIIIGLLVLAMGVLGAIPAVAMISIEPLWIAFASIAIGVISILVGIVAKK